MQAGEFLRFKKNEFILQGGANEVSSVLTNNTKLHSPPDPANLKAAFVIPIWYDKNEGKYYALFGIDKADLNDKTKKKQICPLGGMRENNEKAVGAAFREFFEETINAKIGNNSTKTMATYSKDNGHHLKYVCNDQVYYIVNANIFSNSAFNVNGDVNGTIINFNNFRNNSGGLDMPNFILNRPIEPRIPHKGLYEVHKLIGIPIADIKHLLNEHIKNTGSASNFRILDYVVRGDLKNNILRYGILDHFSNVQN